MSFLGAFSWRSIGVFVAGVCTGVGLYASFADWFRSGLGTSSSLSDEPEAKAEAKGESTISDDEDCIRGCDAGMSLDEFRTHAKELTEWMAQYYEDLNVRPELYPPLAQVTPGYLRDRLPTEAPEHGEPWEVILADVEKHILPGITHWQSPHFFSYFPCASSFAGILGEMFSATFNCIGFSWEACPAYTELEEVVLDWLGRAIGLPAEFLSSSNGGGVIQGTASEALLVAMLASRARAIRRMVKSMAHEEALDHVLTHMVVYSSDQAHSCMKKAAMICGIPDCRYRAIGVDENFAMRVDELELAIENDIQNGYIPVFVNGSLGTTSSTAIDPIRKIGEVCSRYNIWLHVDAAYGGAMCICPEYRDMLMDGIELVDSFDFNPHKWLQVNFDCSAFWVRDRESLYDALSITPEYLRTKACEAGKALDYKDWQIPLGRRFRSLKLWFVIRNYGLEGLRKHVRKGIRLAKRFESFVLEDSRFEVVAPTVMGLVCYRLRASNEINEELREALNASGKLFAVHTKLGDQYVLRFAVGNQQQQEEHVDFAWGVIREEASRILMKHEMSIP